MTPDDFEDFDDFEVEEPEGRCPNCFEADYSYAGELYDDDGGYLGSSYHCENCGHDFSLEDDY